MIRAAIFDLDNTLYDRSAMAVKYFGRLYDMFAVNPPISREEAIARCVVMDERGYGDRPGMHRIMREEWNYRTTDEVIVDEWERCIPECFVPFEGTKEMLTALREQGLLIGMITNGTSSVQREKIRVGGFEPYFDDIVVSREVGTKKPYPEVFHLSLKNLGLRPEEAVYVGDYYPNDIAASLAVGMKAIWYGGLGTAPENPAPVPIVHDMKELLAAILEMKKAL